MDIEIVFGAQVIVGTSGEFFSFKPMAVVERFTA